MNYQDLRALLTKRFRLPKEREIDKAVRRFTLAEKAVFYFMAGVFVLSSIALLAKVNRSFLVDVPLRGGSLTEGIVGNPRFINPVLALSEADRSLSALIYSGLLRTAPDGTLVNDLAENVMVSDDGLTYTAKLRSDAVFHDGEPVTADDVIFTVQKVLDPGVKSPVYGDFAGVTANKVDEHTVTFVLRRPYAPFMNNLTLGILPKHVWSSVTNDEFSFSQWNVLPVGSGPYKVETVTRDNGGIPNYYDLVPASPGDKAPYIAHYVFKFYPSETDLADAYDSGAIDALSGISPDRATALAKKGARVLSSPLPRVFGVFFNQDANKALLDKDVRAALDLAAPKEKIVDSVLGGYGRVLSGPLPAGLFPSLDTPEEASTTARLAEAEELLTDAGWSRNAETGLLEKKTKSDTLHITFTISTSDNPELRAVAGMLRDAWRELGAEVNVAVYDVGDLNQNVIRPRKYEALLFGEVVGRGADVYPFWHSSERKDPGLNIALYANSKTDKLLDEARAENDDAKREELYQEFNEAVQADHPAVFLYSPDFIYVVPKSVKGLSLDRLDDPQDRFAGIRDWYIDTNSVWKLFTDNS